MSSSLTDATGKLQFTFVTEREITMADVWTDERPDHGKWKVTADDGDIRYVSTTSLAHRKSKLEQHLRNLAHNYSRAQMQAETELTQVEADITQIAVEEAPV